MSRDQQVGIAVATARSSISSTHCRDSATPPASTGPSWRTSHHAVRREARAGRPQQVRRGGQGRTARRLAINGLSDNGGAYRLIQDCAPRSRRATLCA